MRNFANLVITKSVAGVDWFFTMFAIRIFIIMVCCYHDENKNLDYLSLSSQRYQVFLGF